MKCALELLTIKAEAIERYEAEERRKDEEAKIAFLAMTENAIELCETTIDNALVKKAEQRSEIIYRKSVVINKDRLGNEYFQLLEESHVYSDRTLAFAPSKECYALTPFITYLQAHCLNVAFEEDEYKTYGVGRLLPCHTIIIKP